MEKTIKLLLEFDREGQQLVQEAQAARQQALDHLDEDRRQLDQQYEQRMKNRLEHSRQYLEGEPPEELERLQAQNQRQSQQLAAQYAANRQKWVAQIVQSCLDGQPV